ncbi:peptide-methionine (S)-S-oxide reductase [bacterium]|nr:peptide-methionine (S)-S-oxide reductase [bacterium]MCI0601430.1 peptide-methionine (S)-S-oxide reductase [bacterium]
MMKNYRAILWGGLLCGTMDITAAVMVYGLLWGRGAERILQSVASGLLGSESYDGGLITAYLGLLLHFSIAFGATTVFYAASRKVPLLLKAPVISGILYGIAVYFFMQLVVVPLSAFPHSITLLPKSLVTGLTIHIFCVGLPISLTVSRFSNRPDPSLKRAGLTMSNSFRLLISTIFILTLAQTASAQTKTGTATFAGGCYWCMEEAFEHVDGVVFVSSGFTAQIEAIQVLYDAEKISYENLLKAFWRNIDPTDSEGQFCDRGFKYTSAIFYHDDKQKAAAEESKREVQKMLNEEVITPILQATQFSPVDEKQQDYYKKNAFQYKRYKMQCGRERRLRSIWKEKD